MRGLLGRALAALERRLLGMSAADIRFTFADVRAELRANHAELAAQLAALRRDVDRLAPPAASPDEGDAEKTAAGTNRSARRSRGGRLMRPRSSSIETRIPSVIRPMPAMSSQYLTGASPAGRTTRSLRRPGSRSPRRG